MISKRLAAVTGVTTGVGVGLIALFSGGLLATNGQSSFFYIVGMMVGLGVLAPILLDLLVDTFGALRESYGEFQDDPIGWFKG